MSPSTLPFYLIGSGGHAKSVASILQQQQPAISLVFVDAHALPEQTLWGFPVITQLPEVAAQSKPYPQVFVAIGYNDVRETVSKALPLPTETLQTIVSTTASVGHLASVQPGTFVGNFVHLGPEVNVAEGCILNTACVLEHEVRVGAYSHISVNAAVGGQCILGSQVWIGAGATVKNNISICSNVIVGVGAVVVKNVTEPGVYVGCPAVKLAR